MPPPAKLARLVAFETAHGISLPEDYREFISSIADGGIGPAALGNAMDARDLQLLNDNRITAVVDLAIDEPPAQLARDMIYCRIPLNDGDGNARAIIEMAVRCVAALVEKDFRTIVACSAGMSRSPAIAAAAMAIHTRTSPDDCLTAIASTSPHDVSPIFWSRVKAVYDHPVRS